MSIEWVYWICTSLLIIFQHRVINALRDDKQKLEDLGNYRIKPDGTLVDKREERKTK